LPLERRPALLPADASCTRMNRRQSPSRSRDVVSRRPGPSAPFHPRLLKPSLSRLLWVTAGLDPRPLLSTRLALFTRNADRRFSGSGYRPTTSATYFPTHGHTPEHPILAFRACRALRVEDRICSRFRRGALLRARTWRPSPLEERSRELRAVTALPEPAQRRCKHAARQDLENHRPIATPLAGDASMRPPFEVMAVGRQRWTARAE